MFSVFYDSAKILDRFTLSILGVKLSGFFVNKINIVNLENKTIRIIIKDNKKYKFKLINMSKNLYEFVVGKYNKFTPHNILASLAYNGFSFKWEGDLDEELDLNLEIQLLLNNKNSQLFSLLYDNVIYKILYPFRTIFKSENKYEIEIPFTENDFSNKLNLINSIIYDDIEISDLIESVSIEIPFKDKNLKENFSIYSDFKLFDKTKDEIIQFDYNIILKTKINLEGDSKDKSKFLLFERDVELLNIVGKDLLFFINNLDFEPIFKNTLLKEFTIRKENMFESARQLSYLQEELSFDSQKPYNNLISVISIDDRSLQWGNSPKEKTKLEFDFIEQPFINEFKKIKFNDYKELKLKESAILYDNLFHLDDTNLNINKGTGIFFVKMREMEKFIVETLNGIKGKVEKDKEEIKRIIEKRIKEVTFEELINFGSIFVDKNIIINYIYKLKIELISSDLAFQNELENLLSGNFEDTVLFSSILSLNLSDLYNNENEKIVRILRNYFKVYLKENLIKLIEKRSDMIKIVLLKFYLKDKNLTESSQFLLKILKI